MVKYASALLSLLVLGLATMSRAQDEDAPYPGWSTYCTTDPSHCPAQYPHSCLASNPQMAAQYCPHQCGNFGPYPCPPGWFKQCCY
ncbi:uncharacterized protein BYT42DRAFT_582085 [Radiomyces spectabilis]|uniref:uncharacterized protein n=1 Tax=Radiomyces spectabilis TaxID=64574 RepID=UPI0022204ACC|nr:uncharacterized protein BYT42DRAFT_582085 [Radiomyces spectabilis]KAI8370365.1 hypothetical protein BYT42DRAFT_582085 [Radiomyces spectabilis]